MKALGAAFAVMVVGGVAHQQFTGRRLRSAQGPSGMGAEFESADAADKTRKAVEDLNRRVTELTENQIGLQQDLSTRQTDLQQDLSKRIADLEAKVFKETGPALDNSTDD